AGLAGGARAAAAGDATREPRRPRGLAGRRLPPNRCDAAHPARPPPPPGEGRQHGPATRQHHRGGLARPDGFPHREHRAARRPPEEGDHARRGAREPARPPEERHPPRPPPPHHAPPAPPEGPEPGPPPPPPPPPYPP